MKLKMLFTPALGLLIVSILGLCLWSCGPLSTQPSTSTATELQALGEQLPGVVDSLAEVAKEAPGMDQKAAAQIDGYAAWTKLAAVGIGTLDGAASPSQAAGAFTSLATLAKQASVSGPDAQQITNYIGWGATILKAAGVIAPLVGAVL